MEVSVDISDNPVMSRQCHMHLQARCRLDDWKIRSLQTQSVAETARMGAARLLKMGRLP